MAKIADNIVLEDSIIEDAPKSIARVASTDVSNFPQKIDEMKQLDFSAASIAGIEKDLKRYYELLIIYLQTGSGFDQYVPEFKDLGGKISKFQLTSKDYATLRDSLIEVSLYVEQFANTEIYSSTGVLTKMLAATADMETKLNQKINEINSAYDNTSGVIPNETVGLQLLDAELKAIFNSLKGNQGMYVDWTAGETINVPEGFAKPPVVIKVRV